MCKIILQVQVPMLNFKR